MILTDRIAHGVADGDVTEAYRRWKHPRVSPGSAFRTVAGIVRIDAIVRADPEQLDEAAAHKDRVRHARRAVHYLQW